MSRHLIFKTEDNKLVVEACDEDTRYVEIGVNTGEIKDGKVVRPYTRTDNAGDMANMIRGMCEAANEAFPNFDFHFQVHCWVRGK